MISEHSAHSTPQPFGALGAEPRSAVTGKEGKNFTSNTVHTYIHTYIFVVVNFDALAQASDIQIERRQVCVPLLNAGFEPGVPDTKLLAD